nr:MAG TPA: hypothetical protein [Ackermannviridae sp.]
MLYYEVALLLFSTFHELEYSLVRTRCFIFK